MFVIISFRPQGWHHSIQHVPKPMGACAQTGKQLFAVGNGFHHDMCCSRKHFGRLWAHGPMLWVINNMIINNNELQQYAKIW